LGKNEKPFRGSDLRRGFSFFLQNNPAVFMFASSITTFKQPCVRHILPESLRLLLPASRRRFDTPEQLTEGLRNMDTVAIEYLMGKTEGTVRSMVRTTSQPPALAHDLLHDGLIILIEKICEGTFDPAKSSPQTYLAGICRKLLANHLRLKQPPPAEPIENGLDIPTDDLRDFLDHKDRLELLELLLEQLGPPGNDLIRLKYLEGYSDEEQME
jgi:RNA polymerase sigma factor (sigma-70 family)